MQDDMRERYVRCEEFSEYKQKLQVEKLQMYENQHRDHLKSLKDHEQRLSDLESKMNTDLLS